MRSNTAPLTSGGIAILLFLFAPLSLCGLWQFGSVFWAGLQTGELIFNSCRTPLSSCLSHIVQAHEPFYFYSGMAVFLFATLLCALMLLGIALSLSQAGNTPEKNNDTLIPSVFSVARLYLTNIPVPHERAVHRAPGFSDRSTSKCALTQDTNSELEKP